MTDPTPEQLEGFFAGLRHAEAIAEATRKGHIAAGAIRKEAVTLRLYHEQKFSVASAGETTTHLDAPQSN